MMTELVKKLNKSGTEKPENPIFDNLEIPNFQTFSGLVPW